LLKGGEQPNLPLGRERGKTEGRKKGRNEGTKKGRPPCPLS